MVTLSCTCSDRRHDGSQLRWTPFILTSASPDVDNPADNVWMPVGNCRYCGTTVLDTGLMPWFKVDDKLHDHEKTRKAGIAAMGLWTLAGSWCMDNLHDGFIPESVPIRWARNYRTLAASLVKAGLWTEAVRNGERGWRFNDWLDYQPSAAKVRKDRAEAKDRMATLRSAAKNGEQGGVCA